MQNAATTTASSSNLQRRSVVSSVFPDLIGLFTNPSEKKRYTRTRVHEGAFLSLLGCYIQHFSVLFLKHGNQIKFDNYSA
uniref:Uncharacterized protein n=1 Tax=Brassica campestris TaxID=3711 RepID=A0A3P6C2W3_BRACM|nr:unnamed protein product [Brassica rapa]